MVLLLVFLDFSSSRVTSSGFNSNLFHICSTFLVGLIFFVSCILCRQDINSRSAVHMKENLLPFKYHFGINFFFSTMFNCTDRIGFSESHAIDVTQFTWGFFVFFYGMHLASSRRLATLGEVVFSSTGSTFYSPWGRFLLYTFVVILDPVYFIWVFEASVDLQMLMQRWSINCGCCCNNCLCVPESLIPSTILSRIRESLRQLQKLHYGARILSCAMYWSMDSPSCCSRLLNR